MAASRTSWAARRPGTIASGSWPQWPATRTVSSAAAAAPASSARSIRSRWAGAAAPRPSRTTVRSASRVTPLPRIARPPARAASTTGACSGQRQARRSKPCRSSHPVRESPGAGGGMGPSVSGNCSNTTAGGVAAAAISLPRTRWCQALSCSSPSSTTPAASSRACSAGRVTGRPDRSNTATSSPSDSTGGAVPGAGVRQAAATSRAAATVRRWGTGRTPAMGCGG